MQNIYLKKYNKTIYLKNTIKKTGQTYTIPYMDII